MTDDRVGEGGEGGRGVQKSTVTNDHVCVCVWRGGGGGGLI